MKEPHACMWKVKVSGQASVGQQQEATTALKEQEGGAVAFKKE